MTLQLRTSKTQIAEDTRALVHHRLYGSVTKWIKYEAFNMLTCL